MGAWCHGDVLASYLIRQHSSHSADNNRCSRVRSLTNKPELFTLPRQKIAGLLMRTGPEWWEQEPWLSPPRSPRVHKQLEGHASRGQGQSEVDLRKPRGVFSLKSRDEGKQMRHETRCFPWHPHIHTCAHTHTLTHANIKAFSDEDLSLNWSLISQSLLGCWKATAFEATS